MQIRFAAAVLTACGLSSHASATPEDFDFFILEAAVGIGGDIDDELLDSDFDSTFITGPSSDLLEIDLTAAPRTLFSRMNYEVSVMSSPGSLVLSASFDAQAEIGFGPGDVNGFVQAFASLDSFDIEFTLDEPQLLSLSHGSAFLGGLDGTPHIGDIEAGVIEIPSGRYSLISNAAQSLIDADRTPSEGSGSFANLLDFSVGLTAVPAPSVAMVFAVGGCGLARRRR